MQRTPERSGPASLSCPLPSWPELIEAERKRLDADTFAERYEALFLGPPEPCETCGWPDPNWNGAIMIVDEDEEPQLCPACGHAIDTLSATLSGVDEDGNRACPSRAMRRPG
jgi:hypothetical protein